MNAGIQVIRVREFLRTSVDGLVDLELSRRVLRDMMTAASASDTPRILVDLRDSQPGMSVADAVELADELGKLGVTPRTRIAVLMPDDHDRVRRGLYLQALATGRGYQIRPHVDFESALAWLDEAV